MTLSGKIRWCMITIYNSVGKYVWKQPSIKSIDETLDYIVSTQCSVSRFGDGEFAIIQGSHNGFQRADYVLANRLFQVLSDPVDNHIVCLPDIFGSLTRYKDNSRIFMRGLLYKERRAWLTLFDNKREYYNAFFTRPYNMFLDKTNTERWFEKAKCIWNKKDILIIEGKFSRLGVGNDLFHNARSIQRILGPERNAFDKYNELLENAKRYGNNKLILIALGMTATVLSYDLARLGFWAIDIGHIDVEYEWYLRGYTEKMCLKGKYVNEVCGGDQVTDDVPREYWESIITSVE